MASLLCLYRTGRPLARRGEEVELINLDRMHRAIYNKLPVWSPGLNRCRADRVLFCLISLLYGAGRGKLLQARVQVAHETLGRRLGYTREWIGTLIDRRATDGWLTVHKTRLDSGRYLSSYYEAGPTLKRLIMALVAVQKKLARQRQTRHRPPEPAHVNDTSQFSTPISEERGKFLFSKLKRYYSGLKAGLKVSWDTC